MYPNLKLQIFRVGIRQNHIAKVLGIDDSILSKIIHGYRWPSEVQRKQLAEFLRAEENWLFEEYEPRKQDRPVFPGDPGQGQEPNIS